MSMLTDLVAYYELEEASGNALDSHGSHDGTETSGTIDSATGKVGNCRDFEAGDTERFDVADHANLSPVNNAFSIALWVQFESLGTIRALVAKGTATVDMEWELIYSSSADRFRFSVSADGTSISSVDGNNFGAPSTATWYLAIAWHDPNADTINIQINNGTADSAAFSEGVFDGADTMAIGCRPPNASHHDGLLDEIAISRRLWTADEKTWIYNSGNGRSYADWVATDSGTGILVPMMQHDHFAGGVI